MKSRLNLTMLCNIFLEKKLYPCLHDAYSCFVTQNETKYLYPFFFGRGKSMLPQAQKVLQVLRVDDLF